MKKNIIVLGLISILLFPACNKATDTSENKSAIAENKSEENIPVEKIEEEKIEEKTDYKELIKGRWVMPEVDGFEPWAFYDEKTVHGDGYEEGVPYKIEGDEIVYSSSKTKIIKLTKDELIEEANGTIQKWKKGD